MTGRGLLPFLLIPVLTLGGCGINDIPTYEEHAKAAWSQVENQYQRRADLIPNLVETVKGSASHERETLDAVVTARAKATSVQVPGDILSNPEAMRQFQASQDALGGALGRLLAVAESYPDLKANEGFLTLQAQIEGSENRLAVARRDFIEAVRRYNTELRTIPGRWWHDWLYPENQPMANFTASEGVTSTPPKVRF